MPFSNIIVDDILFDIIQKLSLFDLMKLSHINPYFYNFCNQNIIWKKYYNMLFDRRIITDKSIHDKPVTFWYCKCGSWPGYMNLHKEITNIKCTNKEHYSNLGYKTPLIEFKNYRKRFIDKYKKMILKDKFMKYENSTKKSLDNSIDEYFNISNKIINLQNNIQIYNQINNNIR